MYSELECGICYQTYNAGRRCPRELQCKHTFCESCLLALSRLQGPNDASQQNRRSILCPMCRHITSISGEGKVRGELRVDECVLERLMAAGVLDREEEEKEAEESVRDGCGDNQEATLLEAVAEESDSFAYARGGTLRRSCRKVWRKITGKNSRPRGRQNFMTNQELRNFAMMSSFMF